MCCITMGSWHPNKSADCFLCTDVVLTVNGVTVVSHQFHVHALDVQQSTKNA